MVQPANKRLVTEAALATARLSIEDRLLARSVDESNQVLSLIEAAYSQMPNTIIIPPISRPVDINYGATFKVTTAGAGSLNVGLFQGVGTGVGLLRQMARIGGSFVAGSQSAFVNVNNVFPLEPDPDNWRVFRLSATYVRDVSSSLVAQIPASGLAISYFGDSYQSSYLEAVKV